MDTPNFNAPNEQTPATYLQVMIQNAMYLTSQRAVEVREMYVLCVGAEDLIFMKFFREFAMLLQVSGGMKELDRENPTVKKCFDWLNTHNMKKRYFDHLTDDVSRSPLKVHALLGAELAMEYCALLSTLGICAQRK